MRDHDLNLLLDSALRTYADPGADSGLEQRILARVSAENSVVSLPAPRRLWLAWSVTLATACCLLLFVVISVQRRIHSPQARASDALPPTPTHRRPMPTAPQSTAKREANLRLPRTQNSVAHKFAPLPKRPVFPTPQPLTGQEQALVAFAARASEPEIQAVVWAQEQAEAPLAIAALQIQPLEQPEQGQK